MTDYVKAEGELEMTHWNEVVSAKYRVIEHEGERLTQVALRIRKEDGTVVKAAVTAPGDLDAKVEAAPGPQYL